MTQQFVKFDEEFLSKYRGKQPNWSPMGYVTYKRTYARDICDDCAGTVVEVDDETNKLFCTGCTSQKIRTEEWWETVKRSIEGAQEIGADYTKEEAEKLFDHIFNLRCNFGGRMLWQLGAPTVRKYGGASLLNCWFTSMNEPEDFCFLFENLMLGGGVGFSVRREDIHELPRIKEGVVITHLNTKDADFIVPDSREGWVALIRMVLDSFFRTGKSFTYSTILIRPYGAKIKGFGGTASGPQILIDGVEKIVKVMKTREGKKLRSTDVLDINNLLGGIVVAGNVRRSAQIAIGDADDIAYLRAKRWDLGGIPNWRSMSNNSIYADSYDYMLPQVWAGYQGNGEPYGFINIPLSQKYGRIKDGLMRNNDMYPTSSDNAQGYNPCAEISLGDGEACNLCEIYLNRIESKEQLAECAKLLYKTQKVVWTLPFHYEKTKKIIAKNFRTGLGVTGICQSLDKLEWLDEAYVELRKFDREWSKKKGYPESIKLTTIKPSGTLSLLGDATPGVHPAYSQFYIRRIRISSIDPVVEVCRKAGLKIDYVVQNDGTIDRNTAIIEFPIKAGSNAIIAKDMTAIKQLELVKKLQTLWSDNSVSVTVYYRKEELPEIQEWLKNNYDNNIKSVSFLLHNEHGFKQAPYEEIDEKTYNELISKVNMESLFKMATSNELLDISCETGVCPVR